MIITAIQYLIIAIIIAIISNICSLSELWLSALGMFITACLKRKTKEIIKMNYIFIRSIAIILFFILITRILVFFYPRMQGERKRH